MKDEQADYEQQPNKNHIWLSVIELEKKADAVMEAWQEWLDLGQQWQIPTSEMLNAISDLTEACDTNVKLKYPED